MSCDCMVCDGATETAHLLRQSQGEGRNDILPPQIGASGKYILPPRKVISSVLVHKD